MEFILIFLISFLTAIISGAGCFGSALLLLLYLTSIVGIRTAVPITGNE